MQERRSDSAWDGRIDFVIVGWECDCGEVFTGEFTLPYDELEDHVAKCDRAPEI